MSLYVVIEAYCSRQRFIVTRGACQFAESIDAEADGVCLLFVVNGSPIAVQAPIAASPLMVYEVVYKVTLSP